VDASSHLKAEVKETVSDKQISFKMYRYILVLAAISFVVGQRLRPPLNPPLQPPTGQRCAGRNYNGRRCCTPELPCGYGEGDCDGPGDGGTNDGHRGCQRGLVCGSNNCLKFGLYYHEKDDCCDLPQSGSAMAGVSPGVLISANQGTISRVAGAGSSGLPLEPPPGQRCAGRNYNGRRCCTPENPCSEGEGDCDGPGDGGLHDGHAGCRGELVCGSNNCRQFGLYYHEKDDCCERPRSGGHGGQSQGQGPQQVSGWGQWSSFGACSVRCGLGKRTRTRQCAGQCSHAQESQDRVCIGKQCGGGGAVNCAGSSCQVNNQHISVHFHGSLKNP